MHATHTIDRRDLIKNAALVGGATVAATGLASAPALADEAAEAAVTPENRWQSEAAAAWRVAPEPVAEADIADGGTFDVVIVGGGQAGTWCARSCSTNGLKVAVLEALDEESFMYVGGEVGHVNSEWAMAHGTEHIDEVEIMNEIFRRNAGRSNQALIRDWVYNSGAYLDWAIEDLGDSEWMEDGYHVHTFSEDRAEDMVMDPSGYKYWCSTALFRPKDAAIGDWDWGKKMMTHQREAAISEGATWLFGHEGYYVEKDESGKACAVIAHNTADDSYLRLTATNGVVLAAGDFSGNVDMVT